MDQNLLPQIRTALNTLNMQPHKLRGQNFLVSEQVVGQICEIDVLKPQLPVMEIGAGLGALTIELAKFTSDLDLVEIELAFAKRLEKIFADNANVYVHNADALQFDYTALYGDQPYQIYGNIPYNITTPLIKKLLTDGGNWQNMVLMVQAEAGRRLVDGKGRANGPLTLMVDYMATSQIEFTVPKEAFYPMPAVQSVVISLQRKVDACPDKSFHQLFAFIDAAFSLRRKTLANSLSASPYGINNAYWQEILNSCDLDQQSRAEALTLTDFQYIYQKHLQKQNQM